MTLSLYYLEDENYIEITEKGDLTSPLLTTHNGRTGDTKTTQLFIRNDDLSKWYSNVVVSSVDNITNGYDDTLFNETGWGIKLSLGSIEPSQGEWDAINWGNSIRLNSIGSDDAGDDSYHAIWYLITCPPNTKASIKTDLSIDVSYTENAVTI